MHPIFFNPEVSNPRSSNLRASQTADLQASIGTPGSSNISPDRFSSLNQSSTFQGQPSGSRSMPPFVHEQLHQARGLADPQRFSHHTRPHSSTTESYQWPRNPNHPNILNGTPNSHHGSESRPQLFVNLWDTAPRMTWIKSCFEHYARIWAEES